jgi:aldehyde:ferredoxin oxidoreductase
MRGWDMETGKPTAEKLTELDLEDLKADVWG